MLNAHSFFLSVDSAAVEIKHDHRLRENAPCYMFIHHISTSSGKDKDLHVFVIKIRFFFSPGKGEGEVSGNWKMSAGEGAGERKSDFILNQPQNTCFNRSDLWKKQ